MSEQPFPYYCYCGCGAVIQVTLTGGFHGTTALIEPCPKSPPYVLAFEVKRSAVLEMQPA